MVLIVGLLIGGWLGFVVAVVIGVVLVCSGRTSSSGAGRRVVAAEVSG